MPRSFVRGSQIDDKTVTDADLADNAVITRTIEDKNVTKPKLADDVCERLLASAAPIARTKLTSDLPTGTEFTLPGGKDYGNTANFLTRVKIWRNGMLQHMGTSALDPDADVYPSGSDTTKIKFACDLRRGATITVEIL